MQGLKSCSTNVAHVCHYSRNRNAAHFKRSLGLSCKEQVDGGGSRHLHRCSERMSQSCRQTDRASPWQEGSITKLHYICVRFLSYHLSARSWVQPPRPRLLLRPHRLHFPAHLRYCSCVCFSFPCCSSGWAFYRIRVSSVIFDLYQRLLSALSDISVDSISAVDPCSALFLMRAFLFVVMLLGLFLHGGLNLVQQV